MTVTVPRADLHDLGRRHRVDYDLDFDPTIEWVRAMARNLRNGGSFGDPSAEVLAETDDLDALADRYEQEAAA